MKGKWKYQSSITVTGKKNNETCQTKCKQYRDKANNESNKKNLLLLPIMKVFSCLHKSARCPFFYSIHSIGDCFVFLFHVCALFFSCCFSACLCVWIKVCIKLNGVVAGLRHIFPSCCILSFFRFVSVQSSFISSDWTLMCWNATNIKIKL